MGFEQIDLASIGAHLLRLVVAFVFALPIGWNRERRSTARLGLRTFPLVAMASCGYVLLGKVVLAGDPAAQARILEGLITGVGFLGGGAIVKQGVNVKGSATAAAIWSTACIGAATAYDRLEIAAALSLATFLVFLGLPVVERRIEREDEGEDETKDAGGKAE